MNDHGIKELGEKGEKEICRILRRKGFPVKKDDGHIVLNGKLFFIEVKNKSRHWNSPPYDGQGTDERTLLHYMDLYNSHKIRTLLFFPGKDGGWIWNFIDVLMKGPTHKIPSNLIVFPFESFKDINDLEEQIPLSRFMEGN